MLKDGKYAAWFRTSRGEGTGIVHLENGKISGGDSIFTYGGSYEIDEIDSPQRLRPEGTPQARPPFSASTRSK